MSEDRSTGRGTSVTGDGDSARTQAMTPVVEPAAPATRPAGPEAGGSTRLGAAPRSSGRAPAAASGSPAVPASSPSAPAAERSAGAPTTVLPGTGRPSRPSGARTERGQSDPRPAARQSRQPARRRARLVLQRVDAWSVFLFSLIASICLGVVLMVAVGVVYAALSSLGVLSSLNGVLGEVTGSGTPDEVIEPFITAGRVMSLTAVLAAVDVVLLTALATLGALLYNLVASLTGGIEVQLGERD